MRFSLRQLGGGFLLICAAFIIVHEARAEDPCNVNITGKSEAQLRADLARCEAEIAKDKAALDATRGEVQTIDGAVKALQQKISRAESTIRFKNGIISELSSDIEDRSEKIEELEAAIERGRESLAEVVRRTHQMNDLTFMEMLLANENLSEFYVDVDDFARVKRELNEHFDYVRGVKTATEEERKKLTEEQERELDARYEVEQQKKEIAENEAEQQELLAAKKQEEQTYEQIVAARQQKAAAIRAELFRLRDTTAIQFGDAVRYAKAAEAKTGVRAAFILAILRQESNLGQNVGQCLLVNPETGAGKGKNTGRSFARVMNPVRDVPPFLSLMAAAGRDPYNTPVSCPQSVGWGGAMGPTQFIPSTWQGISSHLAAALGTSEVDPWNPEHAIMATAVFTKQLGAAQQTYSAEREAAGRYYAGGNWQVYGLGYASSVLGYAEEYQKNIDFISEN